MQKSARRLPAMGLLLVALSTLQAAALGAELPDLVERLRPSIVGVGTAYPPRQPLQGKDPITYLGTGFVVGDGHRVITNAHVLPDTLDTDNRQSLAIFAGRGATARVHFAKVLRRDDAHDLALLAFREGPLPAVTLGDSESVREGQDIAFIGYPIGAVLGLYPATHRGIIAAITPVARPMENARHLDPGQIRRLRDTYVAFQLDATAYPGNSGSPLFELEEGRIVGVVNSVLIKNTRETLLSQPSGISYAVPARHVQRLLESVD